MLIFQAYLTDQTIDHLASTLKRGNIKDLLLFFPPNKRDSKALDAFFREKNLPTVADWYTKKQYAIAKDAIMNELKEVVQRGDDSEAVGTSFLHSATSHGVHGSTDHIRNSE